MSNFQKFLKSQEISNLILANREARSSHKWPALSGGQPNQIKSLEITFDDHVEQLATEEELKKLSERANGGN